MKQAVFRGRIDQQAVTTELQTVTFDLSRQMDYEGVTLQLSGTITNSVAWAALKTQGAWGLIRSVELLVNGQTVLEQAGGYELASIALGLSRGLSRTNAYMYTAPGITAAAHAFKAVLPLDRNMIDMVRPKDTALASRDLATLQLRVTIGQFSDVFTTGGTSTMSATLTATFDAIQEYPSQDGKITVPPYLLKRVQQTVPITATNSNLQVRLPVGNLLRRVSFIERTSGDLAEGLLNNVQLVRGSDVRASMNRNQLYEAAQTLSRGAAFTGALVVDFARRRQELGKVADCWPLAGAADVYAVLDVTSSGASPTISIVTEELIPRIARAA